MSTQGYLDFGEEQGFDNIDRTRALGKIRAEQVRQLLQGDGGWSQVQQLQDESLLLRDLPE